MSNWHFFSNHGHIVFLLSMQPNITLRDIATKIGITERATQRIISDLSKEGYIKITKVGRNNLYKIMGKKYLRHYIEKKCRLEDIIQIIESKN